MRVRQRLALCLLGMCATAGTIAAGFTELGLGTRIVIGFVACLLAGGVAAAAAPWKTTRVERSQASRPAYRRVWPVVRFAAVLGFVVLTVILAPEAPYGPEAWMSFH